MPTFVIVESALELIPTELLNDKTIINHAKRLGRKPQDTLLDKSYHYHAMKRLPNAYKRGRPDILHISLLSITSTPLYREGFIKLYLHTINDQIITLENVRLPKTYLRFEGLMVDLFKKRRIEVDKMLMNVDEMNFHQFIDHIKPKHIIGLSRLGIASNAAEVADLTLKHDAMLIIGGFPRGHFSADIMKEIDELYSISKYGLDTHIVVARLVYELEKRLIG